jgi:hypothetical protein
LLKLKSFTLRYFDGPSLALLALLSSSSRKLSHLDFSGSRWIPSSPPPFPSSPFDPISSPIVHDTASCTYSINNIVDEREAIQELAKFEYLVEAKLGILPTTTRQDYRELEDEMSKRRVEVEWEVCRA